MSEGPDPVGMADIAERLSALGKPVSKRTVESWRARGQLLEPRWIVNGSTPVWHWPEVKRWHELRRSPVKNLEAQREPRAELINPPNHPGDVAAELEPECDHVKKVRGASGLVRCATCGKVNP